MRLGPGPPHTQRAPQTCQSGSPWQLKRKKEEGASHISECWFRVTVSFSFSKVHGVNIPSLPPSLLKDSSPRTSRLWPLLE